MAKSPMMSMTGFARHAEQVGGLQLVVELRAINSRYLDCVIRSPREFSSYEGDIRRVISEKVHRGRVEVSIVLESGDQQGDGALLKADHGRFQQFLETSQQLLEPQGLWSEQIAKQIATEVLIRKDVILERSAEESGVDLAAIQQVVGKAVDALRKSQAVEGQALQADLTLHHGLAGKLVKQIHEGFAAQADSHREQLMARLQEVLGDADVAEERIIAEAAIIADRADISEEISRLNSHLSQFTDISSKERCGRKLDFLLQEFLREANTIASKIQVADLQHHVVDLKTEIERMKEQVQNVE